LAVTNRQEVKAQPYTCPADMEVLDRDRDVFPDKATERKILSLANLCSNDGCDWTGELRNKVVHLASCLFQDVFCTNDNCHVTLKRKDLDEHVTIKCEWRITQCEHCREPHPECCFQAHIEKCEKFPVTCPIECGDLIPREMIQYHIEKKCKLSSISCPYAQMGCDKKLQRINMESHLQSAMGLHLDLTCVKLKNTQVELKNAQETIRLEQVELKNAKERIRKLEQVELKNAQERIRKLEQVELKDAQKAIRKLEEKVHTWKMVWKIDELSRKISEAKTGIKAIIESDPFYTEYPGYKLKVLFCPNGFGFGENTHLSVYIVVMKGEYDAILPWPFNKGVTFTLIDQEEDLLKRENVVSEVTPDNTKSFSRPEVEQNPACGKSELISHTGLQTRRYVVDDTLFLQVEIDLS